MSAQTEWPDQAPADTCPVCKGRCVSDVARDSQTGALCVLVRDRMCVSGHSWHIEVKWLAVTG